MAAHGEIDLGAARIAGHDLHLQAEHVLQDRRIDVVVGTRARTAYGVALRQHVLPGRDTGLLAEPTDAHLVRHGSDPAVFRRVVHQPLRMMQQTFHREPAIDGAHDRAVFGRGGVEIVREAQAAGARHVLGHDERIAGDVLAHVAGEHARVEIVPAARRHADEHADLVVRVEVGDRIGHGGLANARRSEREHGASDDRAIRRKHQAIPRRSPPRASIPPTRGRPSPGSTKP